MPALQLTTIHSVSYSQVKDIHIQQKAVALTAHCSYMIIFSGMHPRTKKIGMFDLQDRCQCYDTIVMQTKKRRLCEEHKCRYYDTGKVIFM